LCAGPLLLVGRGRREERGVFFFSLSVGRRATQASLSSLLSMVRAPESNPEMRVFGRGGTDGFVEGGREAGARASFESADGAARAIRSAAAPPLRSPSRLPLLRSLALAARLVLAATRSNSTLS
jgi:hypothetical protein